jgi:hypothetical protein
MKLHASMSGAHYAGILELLCSGLIPHNHRVRGILSPLIFLLCNRETPLAASAHGLTWCRLIYKYNVNVQASEESLRWFRPVRQASRITAPFSQHLNSKCASMG